MIADADPASWETLGQKLIKEALRYDMDQAEVFISSSRSLIAEIEKNSLKTSKEIIDYGCGLRLVKNGCIGFGFVTNLNQSELLSMVHRLSHLAKSGTPDPDFKSFPSSSSYPTVRGRYDPDLAGLDVTEAVKQVLEVNKSASEYSEKIYSINVSFHASETRKFLLNSQGVEAFDLDKGATIASISAEVNAKDGSEMSSGFDFQHSRHLKVLDPRIVGKNAAELAVRTLNARRIETGEFPVIFHPFALNSILRTGLGAAINAESIQYHRSYLTEKLDKPIGCKLLNVVDNGLLMNNGMAAIGTSAYDGEGTPKGKTQILEQGILKNYLHSSYTAGKAEVSSTGNSYRTHYGYPPFINISNLLVIPQSSKTLDELVAECDNGILMYWTGDTPNLTTGDFSGLIMAGFKISKGSMDFPIKQAMIGFNMFDFLNSIEEIGGDTRDLGLFHTPSLRISKAQIAGES